MRTMLCAGALVLSAASAAGAGPWARGKGNSFLSFGYEVTTNQDARLLTRNDTLTGYAEFGMTPRVTFVFDANLDQTDDFNTLIATMRYTLSPPDATHQFAISAGLGSDSGPVRSGALFVLGASWGRGFETRLGGGWAVLDFQYRDAQDTNSLAKLDATLGLRPAENSIIYAQLQYASPDQGNDTLRLQASYVRDVGKRLKAELGVLYGLRNDEDMGVRSGIWVEF